MSAGLQSINDHLPAPALFSHPAQAAHRSLDVLIIVSDPALATRCVAVLKAAGFDFAADFVSTWVDLQQRLRSKQYGLIIGEPELAPGRGGKLLEALKRNAFDAPFIQLSEHPNPERAEQPVQSYVADCLSTRELARLPLVVERALEAKRRQDEGEWANRAQRLAQDRYQSLFEQDVAGVYRVALDGRILDLNQLGARILGYATCADARTHRLQESASREEDIEYLLTRVQEKKSVNRFEIDLCRRDGQPIRALASASLVDQGPDSPPAIEGMLFDSTSWKRAEEAVRLDEHRFRTLLEKSSDAISLVDSSGHVIYSSHAVSPILGYELDERVGKSVFEFVHPEDAPQVLLVFQKVVSHPFSSLSIQLRYRHKNGSWRWIEALGTNLLEDPGVGAIVINYRDVTEQRGLQEQLFQAQKMEAVGRLAGGVAHDFNNLLTAILGYSDMVLEKLPAHSALRRYTDQIKKAGERAASLTRQLLAFSRLQVMAPQVLDLNTAVSDMGGMLRRVIGENIELNVMAAPTLARVKADPSQVEQVILNLAVNARDAMPQGGELTIQTSNSVVEESFVRDRVLVQAGNYVRIEVSDTGCGMDSEIQAHAFEPFFTTKEKGKGTGLGLSTVYGIVKQSGGYIWLSSEPGKGTTFKIYLPRVDEPPSAVKVAETPVCEVRGCETILLVEDEDSVRELLRQVLKAKGYRVLEAKVGEEGLALCRNYREPIHVILTDVVMPRLSGPELARGASEWHPEAKVLFMTGYAGNKIGAAEVLGKDAIFIQKPFSGETLTRKVRSILDVNSNKPC